MTARSHQLITALPPELLSQADLVGTGEPLWLPAAAAEIVRWADGEEWAVEAGEVYRARGQMQTSFVSDWETSRDDGESWPAYVRRAAMIALAEMDQAEKRDRTRALRFFFVVLPSEC